ncbi:hypothetical protein TNCV_2084541 [Trichonephila clavipes]|uniref:Uncharacterized protein n=1 Tax=Trichonephila clavipes TaxID=2585209 RepID=A0A8X6RNN5_TRICX|nr:hypothetical protein TNCV_2084541 [Trichonephila clavipes]
MVSIPLTTRHGAATEQNGMLNVEIGCQLSRVKPCLRTSTGSVQNVTPDLFCGSTAQGLLKKPFPGLPSSS